MIGSDDVQRVRDKVGEYCNEYRNPKLPPFEISDLYDIQAEWRTKVFPFSGNQGCYVFYSEQRELLYIGKASFRNALGARIAGYFRWDLTRTTLVADGEWVPSPPRFVQTIKVGKAFEAPSLEEYLICELQPPVNVRK
jgi:excinuclease UvrABC nuclease subunit